MKSSSRRTRAPLLAGLAALLVSCSEPPGAQEQQTCPCMSPQRQARIDAALEDLERASERVRAQVLRTCDKWKHPRWECNNEEVRIDSLECWLLVGSRELDKRLKSSPRQRPRDLGVLRAMNMCMNQRRWWKREPGPDF